MEFFLLETVKGYFWWKLLFGKQLTSLEEYSPLQSSPYNVPGQGCELGYIGQQQKNGPGTCPVSLSNQEVNYKFYRSIGINEVQSW